MDKFKIFSRGLSLVVILFCLVFFTPVAFARTASVTVDCWHTGHCLDYSYDCGVSTTCPTLCGEDGGNCYSGLNSPTNCTFTDPVPPGAHITAVAAHISGDNGSPECPYGNIGLKVNGQSITGGTFTTDGSCQFSGFTTNNGPISNYNAGGENTLTLSVAGGISCVSSVELTFTYDPCRTDADCEPNPNVERKVCEGNNWVTYQDGVCDVPTGECVSRETDRDDCADVAAGTLFGCDSDWTTKEVINGFCNSEGYCYTESTSEQDYPNMDECPGSGGGEGAIWYTPPGCVTGHTFQHEVDCQPGPCTDTGNKRCQLGVLQKEQLCSRCVANADNKIASTCGPANPIWVTLDPCGNECNSTGGLRCGGAVTWLGTQYPASTESEYRCTYCIGTGNDSRCVRSTEWRPQWPCWNWGSASLFCVGKDMWHLKLTCPGICVYAPFAMCSFDCTTSLTMFNSCPFCCSGSVYTQFPGIGGPGISCYGSCVAGSTQACGMCGIQTCSGTCAFGACTNEGVCSPGQTQDCVGGGTKTCNATCQWVPDATCQISHTICNASQQCVSTLGVGTDQCQTDADCTSTRHYCNASQQCVAGVGIGEDNCDTNADCQESYNTCNASQQCILTWGVGQDKCNTNADCVGPHNICDSEQCISDPGPGIDECTTSVDCTGEGPTAINLNIPGFDGCINPPGCGIVTFQWIYMHPKNVNQRQFQFQVDDNSNFSSPEVDIVVADLDNPSGSTNSQAVIVRPIPTTVGGNYLSYGTTYYWRVRVWDRNGRSSVWIGSGDSHTTYLHSFPSPAFIGSSETAVTRLLFGSLLSLFNPNEPVTFLDNSVCHNNDQTTYRCKDRPTNIYSWNFGDGSTSNVIGGVTHTYTTAGTYTVGLQVCDDVGCCTYQTTVEIGEGDTPTGGGSLLWKEINPF